MLIYLVRHGETEYNQRGLGLGRADVSLTPHGERQVKALGVRLSTARIDCIYTSPLARCVSTATQVAGGRDIAIQRRDELLELDVGETEGLAFPEMREKYPEFLKAWAGPTGVDIRMPAGESLRDLERRLIPFAGQLLESPAEAVAVVSHNFVTRILLTHLLGLDISAFRSLNVDLASLTTITIRNKRAAIRALNDCCHLHALEP
jgi:broad specificity phosphatase PhoE